METSGMNEKQSMEESYAKGFIDGMGRASVLANVLASCGDSLNSLDAFRDELRKIIKAQMAQYPTWQACHATSPQAVQALTDDQIFELVGQVLGQPLIADDLREGFSLHTEPRDWLNFARALRAAPQSSGKTNDIR